MDLGLLRRLAGGKRGPRRARVARVPPPDMETHQEMEASRRPRRNFAREGVHAMPRRDDDDEDGDASEDLIPRGDDDDDDDEDQDPGEDLINFYNDKVEASKDKAGDDEHAPISGNLYSYLALKGFGEATGLFQSKSTRTMRAGLYFVIIIQIIGPVAVLVWAYWNMAPADNGWNAWGLGGWVYVHGSRKQGISNLGKRVLGLLFIILFALNGAYAMDKEAKTMEKTLDLVHVFKAVAKKSKSLGKNVFLRTPPKPKTSWLWIGAFINAWCLILCTLSCLPVMLFSESPKDILFDALGLTFLYNLDDIGGDLCLLDEEWDEDQFGDLFGELADAASDEHPLEGGSLLKEIRKSRHDHATPDNLLDCARYVMFVLLFVLPVVYIFMNFEERDSIEEDHIAALASHVGLVL